jgi:hypothetical protein
MSIITFIYKAKRTDLSKIALQVDDLLLLDSAMLTRIDDDD